MEGNYNKFKYFELLKYEETLKNENKRLFSENRDALQQLLKYKVLIRDHIFWENKIQFISIITNFLIGNLDSEEFEDDFCAITNKTEVVFEAFATDFEKLENFEPDSKSKGFSSLINNIVSNFEVFEADAPQEEIFSEKWLKDSVKNTFLQIQKYL